jgi:uncharacterized protein YjlB
LPVVILLSEDCVFLNGRVQKRLSEDFSVLGCYAEGRREDTRLVPATKVLFVQAVNTEFSQVDDRSVSVW